MCGIPPLISVRYADMGCRRRARLHVVPSRDHQDGTRHLQRLNARARVRVRLARAQVFRDTTSTLSARPALEQRAGKAMLFVVTTA